MDPEREIQNLRAEISRLRNQQIKIVSCLVQINPVIGHSTDPFPRPEYFKQLNEYNTRVEDLLTALQEDTSLAK